MAHRVAKAPSMTEVGVLDAILTASRAGDYERVVALGRTHIEVGGDESAIIIVYADALKECNYVAEAREAYLRALTRLPAARHAPCCRGP